MSVERNSRSVSTPDIKFAEVFPKDVDVVEAVDTVTFVDAVDAGECVEAVESVEGMTVVALVVNVSKVDEEELTETKVEAVDCGAFMVIAALLVDIPDRVVGTVEEPVGIEVVSVVDVSTVLIVVL